MKWHAVGRCEKSASAITLVADLPAELAHLLMRQLQEVVEQAELVHHLERRGMDGVAAEVAQEIGVLLEHHDVDAGARQQKAEHHAGRPAAGDGASSHSGSHAESGRSRTWPPSSAVPASSGKRHHGRPDLR